jgi:copper chaperone CopZ
MTAMAVATETFTVSGIRCERCVHRLSGALRDVDGLEWANANLLGEVTLSFDDERVSRGELVERLARAGFREQLPAGFQE